MKRSGHFRTRSTELEQYAPLLWALIAFCMLVMGAVALGVHLMECASMQVIEFCPEIPSWETFWRRLLD